MHKILLSLTTLLISLASCNAGANTDSAANNNPTSEMESNNTTAPDTSSAMVDIKTSLGDIRILLYGETPKHRDNFIKLVESNFYNGTLFHRVINKFMIQAGDPDSKGAAPGKMLGAGGPGYQIDAEIVYPKYFHKRGALAAARQGDQVNPERKSSGSQFYIVTGDVVNDSAIKQMEQQLNIVQQKQIFNQLAMKHRDQIMAMQQNQDYAGLQALQQQLLKETEAEAAKNPLKLTPEQIEAYTSVGGTPHLDNQYTVFGEIVSGMDVVAKIEKVKTDQADRPTEDVKIISMEIVK
ncbi:MAG: peptidylprolyl isomerase [Muribaculaceae bacterium]|nr:peptidylprolyl isomerase [Muribaculaceae bacterium]